MKKKPTLRQQRAAKMLADSMLGRVDSLSTKKEILVEAGYSENLAEQPGRIMDTPTFREALQANLAEAGINPAYALKKVKFLMESKEHAAVNNGLTQLFKITGAYAPVETKTETTGTITHKFESDNGDYAEFLKQKNTKLDYIDGEIVEDKTN